VNIKEVHSAYFIGIGGIGMSAIARWFHHNGVKVAGYDKTPSPLTERLQQEGIDVVFDESVDALPDFVKEKDEKVLLVYTPAIPAKHKAFSYLKENAFKLYKRSEVLGEITKGLFTIAVAGTHGKTTTSSMVAHILKHSGENVTGFLGGISVNYDTNMLLNEGEMNTAKVVVEADEFDRSFLTLHPNIAIVTSTDADHLDIYGEANELKKSFAEFLQKVNAGGQIFIKEGLWEGLSTDKIAATHSEYAIEKGTDVKAFNIRIENGAFSFDVAINGELMTDFELAVPGYHNVENATAAIAVAKKINISTDKIKAAIASYKGVKRRFEYIIRRDDFVFIDDYAHHPSEISAMLKSARALFPDKKLTVLFQPHLYSRTRDFADGFSESLSLADEALLLDIYPAREEPIEGVNSEMLLSNITADRKLLLAKEEVENYASNNRFEVFITLGAGDIDRLVAPLKEIFNKTYAV
jgi:UDP-N-acetylmuramate--alanine ligase